MNEKLQKFDKPLVGVIIGAVLPIIGFFISYPILTRENPDMDLARYFHYLQVGPDRQNVMIFCMLPNMFLFYFTNFRWNLTEFTKGLVAVTLLLGLLLVLLTVF